MKNIKLIRGLILLMGLSISGIALADSGHGRHGGRSHIGVGLYFGIPHYYYPYYPSPYYYYPYSYYPPVVVTPAQPLEYVEQGDAQQQADPSAPESYYWYHCDKPEGYYPYIKECPGGWQKVSPTPPPQP